MWPFGTIATLRREKDEYKATMGRLLSEAREAGEREISLRQELVRRDRHISEMGDIVADLSKERDEARSTIVRCEMALEQTQDQWGKTQVAGRELQATLDAQSQELKAGAQVLRDANAEIKRLTDALAKAQKNDSPQDKKSGRFVKKPIGSPPGLT